MKIGIIFDLKDDYNLKNTAFCDFTCLEEVMILANILSEMGHKVKLFQGVDIVLKSAEYIKNSLDVVINLTEGHKSRSREALVPALLEMYDIPFIGSDCYASVVSLDKYLTKLIARNIGVCTPDFALYLWRKETVIGDIPNKTEVVLKPVCEGSSDGVERKEAKSATLKTALKKMGDLYEQNILLEEYIAGSDYSVALIGIPAKGYSVLGAVKIVDKQLRNLPIYSSEYKANYDVVKTVTDWSDDMKNAVYSACIKLAETIELSGFCRFDFRISGDKYYFLEINSVPSLSNDGSFIKAIELNKLDKHSVFERILTNEDIEH